MFRRWCRRIHSFFSNREARRELRKLRNIHEGEACFVIGMGPSLLVEDLVRLGAYKTFACNKIYLAYEDIEWRPTYYTVSDVLVAKQNRDAISQVSARKLFPSFIRQLLADQKDIVWIPCAVPREFQPGCGVGFSTDLTRGIQPNGYSVIYDQLQIAYHMGFSTVYLIGVDFSFSTPKFTDEECAHGRILEGQGEVNHFHKDYRKKGEKWTEPRLDKQKIAFSVAKKAYEADGRKVLNASRSTMLDVFDRIDFDDVVSG